MTLQTPATATPFRPTGLRAALQTLADFLRPRPPRAVSAPASSRLRRDAGLAEHADDLCRRDTAQDYRNRHMTLL